ncbi:hypothetical protein BgiBS90_023763 [Biomphalaria glabrata]|nr:hypothetical protein BgiBS90_023763 [Biomphalaria glabrata]
MSTGGERMVKQTHGCPVRFNGRFCSAVLDGCFIDPQSREELTYFTQMQESTWPLLTQKQESTVYLVTKRLDRQNHLML